jgi:hypothetical protein
LNVVIDDIYAEINGLEHGAGLLLFVNDGFIDMLEGYSMDEVWTDQPAGFRLHYMVPVGFTADGSRGFDDLNSDLDEALKKASSV